MPFDARWLSFSLILFPACATEATNRAAVRERTADEAANASPATAPSTVAAATPTAGPTLRIAAGRTTAFTDAEAHEWSADSGFTGGVVVTHDPALAIANTTSPELYSGERYDPSTFRYDFAVPNGDMRSR